MPVLLNTAGDGPSDTYLLATPPHYDEDPDEEPDETDGPSACTLCTMRSLRNCRQCQRE
jgi:hypothetical protein